ncbi:hypothetical protein Krac_11509 [Ktedonobacter racemifer DSM 44963]|uniref:Uncharacterized protein n=1 Tax=Ktedonobacter racemifer DSM 44963 TaxID=485913 RepID=D6TCA3_KTERA|nr:hypothetical protein Krac_11509 [Ktedonobacter racemifer DSM 44963]
MFLSLIVVRVLVSVGVVGVGVVRLIRYWRSL